MVEVKGLEKFAPKDYPGHISSTLFVGGCNFRCPFCHNSDLVLNPGELPSFPMDYLLGYLDSRKGWLEAVCVTGGEPLIHEEIDVLLQVIKDRGYLVKVETNGTFPERLSRLMKKNLLDHVAMDVKTSLDKYPTAVNAPVNLDSIRESISILLGADLEVTFRTTAVPNLVDGGDIAEIGRLLKGAPVFQIQQFFPERAMDPAFRELAPYTPEKIRELGAAAEPFFPKVRVEGV